MGKLKTELIDAAAAFLLSTFAAMLVLPFSDVLVRLLRLAWYGQFEVSRVLAMSNPYSHFGMRQMWLAWLVFMLASAIPYAVGLAVMRYFRFRHWLAYLVFGEVTAFLTCVMPGFIFSFRRWRSFEDALHGFQSYLVDILRAFPAFLLCGVVAGGVCAVYFHLRTHRPNGIAETVPSSLPLPEGQAARG